MAATAAPLRAANIHVSPAGGGDGSAASPTDLQTALTTAATNGESDAIFLQSGTYPAAATFTFAVETVTADSTGLLVSGGWNAGFTAQTLDRSSVLDGQGARRVLKVTAQGAGANVTVSLENLTVRNGWTNEYAAPPGDTGSGAGILALNLDGAQLKLVMRQCALLDNVALEDSSRGGGLAISCDHELRECVFGGNRAEGGGAIHQWAAAPYTQALAPLIDGCAFQDNLSVAQGGSHLFTNLSPVVVDSWFYGRPGGASSGGGAVNVINGGHPTFERCEFSGNVADHWGGAIHLWDAGAEILGCLFEGNAAGAAPGSDGRGGALTMYDPDGVGSPRTVTVVNSTFVGNRVLGSLAYGGAIYNRIQTLVVHNSIFWDNGSPDFQGSYRALYRESGAATVSFSDIQGGLTSTGFTDGGSNITAAPYTGEPWDYPYRLLADSPCVDAGSNAAVPAGLISDREDHPRIFGGHDPATRVVDMGADEYYNGVFLVTVPSKNTSWLNNGAAKTIAWTCTNIPGDVRLSLWLESPAAQGVEVAEIAASVPCAAQSRGWTLPAGLPDGLDYVVVMQSLEMAALVEWNYVAIQHLHLNSPKPGSLLQGAKYPLTVGEQRAGRRGRAPRAVRAGQCACARSRRRRPTRGATSGRCPSRRRRGPASRSGSRRRRRWRPRTSATNPCASCPR